MQREQEQIVPALLVEHRVERHPQEFSTLGRVSA